MTRQIVRLDSNTTQQSINLEFDAEILSVINPTAQSIGVSVGGNIPPQNVQSADIWIPADSGINYPVVGRNFAAAFMPPLLVNAPTGIPTAANLFFTAQEPVPNFGAFPLSTLAIQSLADTILLSVAIPGATYTNSITITSDILSIGIFTGGGGLPYNGTLQVTGHQSGYNYAVGALPPPRLDRPIMSVDTQLDITVANNANAGLTLLVIGHRYVSEGARNSGGGLVQFERRFIDTAPDYSAYNWVLNPVAGASIAQIANLPAGVYRIEYEVATDYAGAPALLHAWVQNTTANQKIALFPFFVGYITGTVTGYFSSAAFTLDIINTPAVTNNSVVHGALRVWKLWIS